MPRRGCPPSSIPLLHSMRGSSAISGTSGIRNAKFPGAAGAVKKCLACSASPRVTLIVCALPSRTIASWTARPAGISRIIRRNCAVPSTRWPLISVTTSFSFRPLFAARLLEIGQLLGYNKSASVRLQRAVRTDFRLQLLQLFLELRVILLGGTRGRRTGQGNQGNAQRRDPSTNWKISFVHFNVSFDHLDAAELKP